MSIPYHCDNATSSPVLIPVYLASANPMTQRNSTDIHALTNMHIPTAMSHVCLYCHTIDDSRQQINLIATTVYIGCFANWYTMQCGMTLIPQNVLIKRWIVTTHHMVYTVHVYCLTCPLVSTGICSYICTVLIQRYRHTFDFNNPPPLPYIIDSCLYASCR